MSPCAQYDPLPPMHPYPPLHPPCPPTAPLASAVTFGDSSDARSATPEDLNVERLRLGYFGLTSFLAALLLLNVATSFWYTHPR